MRYDLFRFLLDVFLNAQLKAAFLNVSDCDDPALLDDILIVGIELIERLYVFL